MIPFAFVILAVAGGFLMGWGLRERSEDFVARRRIERRLADIVRDYPIDRGAA